MKCLESSLDVVLLPPEGLALIGLEPLAADEVALHVRALVVGGVLALDRGEGGDDGVG